MPTREGEFGSVHVMVRITVAKNGYYVRDLVLQVIPVRNYASQNQSILK